MISDEKKMDFIDRYLMGKLSLHELATIENYIRTDPTFAEDVAFQRNLLLCIRKDRRAELKRELSQVSRKSNMLRLPLNRTTMIRFAIAASITILVMGSVFYEVISDATTPNSKRGHYYTSVE